MPSPRHPVDPDRIMAHVRHLAETIGPRLAGSEQEQQGADYIEAQMRRIGLQDVEQQPFACKWYEVNAAQLQARFGTQWRTVTMDAVAHTPSTNGVLEAELVYVETATDDILDRVDLKDKVALVHGTYGPNTRMIQRFRQMGVAAVIWTDVRYPMGWNILVGLPWSFLPIFDFPAASVPHSVEWDMVSSGVDRVRLNLDVVVEDRQSQNVVGRLPGKSPDGGVLVCGHHDSVRNCTGAEDNAAGAACALEVAEVLAGMELQHPVTFVSFGTEEQLSQGSFVFVDEPRNRAEQIDLVLNVDGQGCWTGENEIYLTGSPELHQYMRRQMTDHNWSGVIRDEPDGFSDHFPFIVKGVPAAWFHRRNCAGGRWFHHSVHETVDVLSPKVLSDCAELIVDLTTDVAGRPTPPFAREFPPETTEAVKRVADGWLKL